MSSNPTKKIDPGVSDAAASVKPELTNTPPRTSVTGTSSQTNAKGGSDRLKTSSSVIHKQGYDY